MWGKSQTILADPEKKCILISAATSLQAEYHSKQKFLNAI